MKKSFEFSSKFIITELNFFCFIKKSIFDTFFTIAFTKFLGGEFYIGVMYTDGKGERVVYKSYLVEGPTWSPNGRVLSFYSQTKLSKGIISAPKIKLVDLTGVNLRQLITPSDASDPSWSGLLP